MMKSLFADEGRVEVLTRIHSVSAESPRQWGTMSVAQMLSHCRVPLEVACGTRTMKRSMLGRLLGWMVKGGATGPKPFKHGLPTDPRFVTDTPGEVSDEARQLCEALELFCTRGPEPLETAVHTFFGKMRPEQWDQLMWKHLDHHLRQFDS